MFLIDEYKKNSEGALYHKEIINRLLNSPDKKKEHFINTELLKQIKDIDEFVNKIKDESSNNKSYSNFPHLLLYGPPGSGKGHLVNMLLEKIYDKSVNNIKEVQYTVVGYGNSKTKVDIKQSNYHIIVEPNNNGFDKYLIQEIVQEYARRQMLNIFRTKKNFKIVLVDTVDNLSYYAQASLRRTMEKYVNNCKFILLSHQLSNVIEPLRSRCLCIRIPLANEETIFQALFNVTIQQKINLSLKQYNNIINKADNHIEKAIWLLQLHTMSIPYIVNWHVYMDKIIDIILKINLKMKKRPYLENLAKIRNLLYNIFITNIEPQTIIREIMNRIVAKINSIELKAKIIESTSEFEFRLSSGKRHVLHLEAYVHSIVYLLNIKDTSTKILN
ncbi:DNA polymerase III, delta subunit [seawater metagenome]|uniref:DNA polymerase III, delta subunit n=1 Tax=seawater metagenome TaxID=1561972 RepID=A0A5E8CJP6_9ZZZZ